MGGAPVWGTLLVATILALPAPALLLHGRRRWCHHVWWPIWVLATVWVLLGGCLLRVGWSVRPSHVWWWVGLLLGWGLHKVRVALWVCLPLVRGRRSPLGRPLARGHHTAPLLAPLGLNSLLRGPIQGSRLAPRVHLRRCLGEQSLG